MIKLPLNNRWKQPNNSYKEGSIWYTKNITLDEEGIIKLSPRMFNFFDDSETTTSIGSTNFDTPVAFGRYAEGTMYVVTKDEPFNVSIGQTEKSISEDTSSNNPNLSSTSHGTWWQGRWYESYDTGAAAGVSYVTTGTWTAGVITGLTPGVRHYLSVFQNKNNLAVSNGNTVKIYDTSHSNTATLTLPADFEVIGLTYNSYKLGIITRLGGDSAGENKNSFFFTWDGASSEASTGIDIGAISAISVFPYKSSFGIITSQGQVLYWNGGGFDKLVDFPFYFTKQRFGDNTNFTAYGDNVIADGDTLLINLGFNFDSMGTKGEKYIQNNPSGIWCYDPSVGLYHKYSPSNSRAYFHWITTGNVNTTTNIITTSGTIPQTGSPLIVNDGAGSAIGGIVNRKVYYVIKLTSTTFKIAETYQNALDLVAVDFTSATDNVYLWMYDIKDYGATFIGASGGVSLLGSSTDVYTDIIAGSRIYGTDDNGSGINTLEVVVPFLKNIGYFITPKLFLNSQTENLQKLVIKHRPLKLNDKIIIKVKTKEYLGLPTSSVMSPNNKTANWTALNVFTTITDLSEAMSALNNGEEMEIEFLSGVGAGQLSKITDITYNTGTYTVTTEDDIVGASSGLKSNFIIDNWKVCDIIDYNNQTFGLKEISIADVGKSPQIKVELQGYETAIEEINIITNPQIK
jgi:hypothetical protein